MTLTLSLRPDVTVVAVPLPNEYNRFDAEMFWENDCMSFVNAKIPLPPGQYEIVGLLREIPEEHAAGLMEYVDDVSGYLDYSESYNLAFDSAIDSFKTLIGAQGGDPEANWLIIKKIQ